MWLICIAAFLLAAVKLVDYYLYGSIKPRAKKTPVTTKSSSCGPPAPPSLPHAHVGLTHMRPEDPALFESLSSRFIAFDVETTGLNRSEDRIIQIGAVLFEGSSVSDRFTTLVNPQMPIPPAASKINHITDDMVRSSPTESDISSALCAFLGDAIDGRTLLVAHNAEFDMSFLSNMLMRCGVSAHIRFVDTLELSRRYLRGLDNYKQITVAASLGLSTGGSHRADVDAEICGKILLGLLPKIGYKLKRDQTSALQRKPSPEELGICAYILDLLASSGRSTGDVRFRKNSDGSVSIQRPYQFASFKVLKTKPLSFSFPVDYYVPCGLESAPSHVVDGLARSVRVQVGSLDSIPEIAESLFSGYDAQSERLDFYIQHIDWFRQDLDDSFQISPEDVSPLIDVCRQIEAQRQLEVEEKRSKKSRPASERKPPAPRPAPAPSAQYRPVGQYDDDSHLIATFDSISAAASTVGINPKGIREVANGRQKHAAGFVWKYLDSTPGPDNSIETET